jgi:hypothetical protein
VTAIDITVGSGQDAMESTNTGDSDSNNFDVAGIASPGGAGANEHVAARFTGITIPAGATITSAYVQWYVTTLTAMDVDISFQDASAPVAFNGLVVYTDSTSIVYRTYTSAVVQWTGTMTGSAYNSSPSLVSIINELIASYTYSSGSMLCLLHSRSSNLCIVRGYLYGGASYAAKLHIEYSTPSLEQEGYRFRNDDGNETGASWAGNQDNEVTAPAGTNLRLRVLVNATGDQTTTQYQLEYKKSIDSIWMKV